MKNRILTFIIGVLVGAIVAISGLLIYSKVINKNQNGMMIPMERNEQMQRPDGNMENPPEKPEKFQENMQKDNV